MNNSYVNSIRKQVKNVLESDKKRYRHSLSVAHTAACLAYSLGLDDEKAFVAGLLHDCAKCYSDRELLEISRNNSLEITPYELESPYLLHAKVGALHAKQHFQCDDEDILNAITYHTTGRPNMSPLEEIIFLADYIEPYRDKAANLSEVRALAFKDIKEAIYVVTRDTLDYLRSCNKPIDPLTYETFKYYEAETCDKGFTMEEE